MRRIADGNFLKREWRSATSSANALALAGALLLGQDQGYH